MDIKTDQPGVLANELQKALNRLTADLDQKTEEQVGWESKAGILQSRCLILEEELNAVKPTVQNLQRQVREQIQVEAQLRQLSVDFAAEKLKNEEAINLMLQQRRRADSAEQTADDRLRQLQSKHEQMKEESQKHQKALKQLTSVHKSEKDVLEKQIAALQEDVRQLTEQVTLLRKTQAASSKTLSQAHIDQAWKQRVKRLAAELEEVQNERDALRQRIK